MQLALRAGEGEAPLSLVLVVGDIARHRFGVGPGGSSVSEGRFRVNSITESPGFLFFVPLDINHGRSGFCVSALISKEHDLGPPYITVQGESMTDPVAPKTALLSL